MTLLVLCDHGGDNQDIISGLGNYQVSEGIIANQVYILIFYISYWSLEEKVIFWLIIINSLLCVGDQSIIRMNVLCLPRCA